ncbi:MAG: hypothetical protein ACLFR8_11255 [Alkalispirochaeta sp.]
MTKSFIMMLLIITMNISAQQAGVNYLDIEVGVGIPTGDFGDDDIDSEDSGLASTGVMGSITGRYSLEDNFGLFGQYSFNLNSIDSEVLDDVLDEFADMYPTVDWEISASPWVVQNATIGPYFSTTSGNAVFLLGGGIGLLVATKPELELTGDDGVDELVVKDELVSGVGFGYTISGRIGYLLSDKVTLFGGISFVGGEAEIDYDVVVELNGDEIDSTSESFAQPISIVNIPIGISISF